MTEELGEISACVTKGKDRDSLAEECADLLILLIGTGIAADFNLDDAFWAKMKKNFTNRDENFSNEKIFSLNRF